MFDFGDFDVEDMYAQWRLMEVLALLLLPSMYFDLCLCLDSMYGSV